MVNWDYFDKFDVLLKQYMERSGEGSTRASQVATAVNKLVYKWYNDGDVFDNTGFLDGWCNDLSSYANWLFKYAPKSRVILNSVYDCYDDGNYEELLKDLADTLLDGEYLEKLSKQEKVGSIYECEGKFRFVDSWDD